LIAGVALVDLDPGESLDGGLVLGALQLGLGLLPRLELGLKVVALPNQTEMRDRGKYASRLFVFSSISDTKLPRSPAEGLVRCVTSTACLTGYCYIFNQHRNSIAVLENAPPDTE
jgi:hypothetical protein